jgi:hypothetical protein
VNALANRYAPALAANSAPASPAGGGPATAGGRPAVAASSGGRLDPALEVAILERFEAGEEPVAVSIALMVPLERVLILYGQWKRAKDESKGSPLRDRVARLEAALAAVEKSAEERHESLRHLASDMAESNTTIDRMGRAIGREHGDLETLTADLSEIADQLSNVWSVLRAHRLIR